MTIFIEVCAIRVLSSNLIVKLLQVILSGGCCRIPALRQQVQDYFSGAEFINGIAADEAIAVGCAIEVLSRAFYLIHCRPILSPQ